MGRPRHHPPQRTLCAPGRGLCSANKAGADTPEKALVPNPKAIHRRGHKGPHHGTLLCISYGATESPRRQRWAFSAEHPATHTQRSRGRGRQRSVHRQARASERMNERVPGSAAEKGLSLRPRTPPSSSSTPCPTVTHTRGFIFLIKKTTYFLTPISQNQTDAQALQCLHCCLLHLSYFERRWLWTYDTMATEARELGSWAACHGHHLCARTAAQPLSFSEPPELASRLAAITACSTLALPPHNHAAAMAHVSFARPQDAQNNREPWGSGQVPALGHLSALQSAQGLEASRVALPGPPSALCTLLHLPGRIVLSHVLQRQFPGPGPAPTAHKQQVAIPAHCGQGAALWQGCAKRRWSQLRQGARSHLVKGRTFTSDGGMQQLLQSRRRWDL